MKKKRYALFGLALLFLLFLCDNVKASIRCSYNWNGETIILEKSANSDSFDKIMANINISIANGETIKESQENTCPSVSFYKGMLIDQKIGSKIYSSFSACTKDTPINGECTLNTPGILLQDDNPSSGSILGKKQAVLVKKENTFCEYEAEERYHFTISSTDGRTYAPDYKCKDQNYYGCSLKSNGSYFYSGSAQIKCPTYIYYDCNFGYNLITGVTNKCTIIGSGGNNDSNSSGSEGIKGDEPYTPLPPIEIETGPLDCDGIFQGPLGDFLKEAWKLIKFAVPILILALSIVDFLKSISAHDEAEVKKAANKLVKRLIIGVIIFVLPTIIELLLHIAGFEFGTCDIR